MRRVMKRTLSAALFLILAALIPDAWMVVDSASAQVPVGSFQLFAPAFTPVATAAAIGTTEQTVTITGANVTDLAFVVGPAAPTSLCPAVGARVSAANTVAIQFATLTAAACTPPSGSYKILIVRP